jgi:hypothetical protein
LRRSPKQLQSIRASAPEEGTFGSLYGHCRLYIIRMLPALSLLLYPPQIDPCSHHHMI